MSFVRRLVPRYSLRTLVLFLLLVTSGTGLWWRREPWRACSAVSTGFREIFTQAELSTDGSTVETGSTSAPPVFADEEAPATGRLYMRRIWSTRTGRLLEVLPLSRREEEPAPECVLTAPFPDGRRILRLHQIPSRIPASYVLTVEEAATGRFLWRFEYDLYRRPIYRVSSDGSTVVAGGWSCLVVYRRRRPEWWWGVFWLRELWLTAILAAAFAWSAWRDRRAPAAPALA